MENYIMRVYRRAQDNPEQVTGILESVEQQTQQVFHSLETLNGLLQEYPAVLNFANSDSDKKTVGK